MRNWTEKSQQEPPMVSCWDSTCRMLPRTLDLELRMVCKVEPAITEGRFGGIFPIIYFTKGYHVTKMTEVV